MLWNLVVGKHRCVSCHQHQWSRRGRMRAPSHSQGTSDDTHVKWMTFTQEARMGAQRFRWNPQRFCREAEVCGRCKPHPSWQHHHYQLLTAGCKWGDCYEQFLLHLLKVSPLFLSHMRQYTGIRGNHKLNLICKNYQCATSPFLKNNLAIICNKLCWHLSKHVHAS